MPGFDGSGPQGRGSMTGRGFGYCRQAYQPTQQPVAALEDNKRTVPNENALVNQPPVQGQPLVYGFGCGMMPWGGGRRLAFGVCKRRRGRCFGTYQV